MNGGTCQMDPFILQKERRNLSNEPLILLNGRRNLSNELFILPNGRRNLSNGPFILPEETCPCRRQFRRTLMGGSSRHVVLRDHVALWVGRPRRGIRHRKHLE